MGGSIQVPNNIEDKTILKRFLTDLVLGINSNTLFSGNVQEQNAAIVELLNVNPNMDFLNIVSKLTELRTDILTYVSDNIETVILQNTEDVAVIAEQFGTFYNQALAASWYGLSVKAGGAVAGLEVGSLDPDVTTPGDESSYFRVVANNFILGRAYEDLTQAEKEYLSTNNLPSFGTVYDANKNPVPALVTTWDGGSQIYRHYFNGIVQFSNISGADYANAINLGTTTINGGKITTSTLEAKVLKPAVSDTTVWAGGALVSQNFDGNAVGNIGNPTTGFRLSSNAAGTSTDPNIYGAYIKGATLEGTALTVSDLKVKAVGYVNNFGPLSLSHKYVASSSEKTTYATSDIFYGRGYSSGYLPTRMCPSTLIFTLTVTGSTWINTPGDMGTNYAYIQVRVNSGEWTTIYTSPALRMQLGGQYNYPANTLDNIQFRAYINNTYSAAKLTIVELDILATNYGS